MVFALVKKQLKKKANCLYSIFKYCEETLWDFFGGCSEIISSRYSEKTIAPEGDLCYSILIGFLCITEEENG